MFIVYSDISMAFQSCIQNAQQNFSMPYLVQSGVISASSANPPQWIAVGGVLASSFISCLADDYWANSPIQPIISNNYTTITQNDNSQFSSVVNFIIWLIRGLSQSEQQLFFY